METAIAPMVLVVVPALACLTMGLTTCTSASFFASVLVGGLGSAGAVDVRGPSARGTMYYGCLILALVVALVGVVLAGKAKAKDGVITLGGREQPGSSSRKTAYLAFFLTVVITAVLLLAPLALGTAMGGLRHLGHGRLAGRSSTSKLM